MSDRAWVSKYPLKCDKVQWLQTHCGQAWISLGKSLYKDILFLCPQRSSGPYISRNFLIWTHFVNASWKKSDLRTHISSTTQGNKHALITMMYFSRKLNNKVITKVCNFWRQVACSSRFMATQTTIISALLRLEKLCFEFPASFHLTNIDVTSCFCRQFFRPLDEDKSQKIATFNGEYLGDACFNSAETVVHIKQISLEFN